MVASLRTFLFLFSIPGVLAGPVRRSAHWKYASPTTTALTIPYTISSDHSFLAAAAEATTAFELPPQTDEPPAPQVTVVLTHYTTVGEPTSTCTEEAATTAETQANAEQVATEVVTDYTTTTLHTGTESKAKPTTTSADLPITTLDPQTTSPKITLAPTTRINTSPPAAASPPTTTAAAAEPTTAFQIYDPNNPITQKASPTAKVTTISQEAVTSPADDDNVPVKTVTVYADPTTQPTKVATTASPTITTLATTTYPIFKVIPITLTTVGGGHV
ncbi:uncharacterized protein K489DRAFT_382759 [Dissoconium aciculare CBS 342.82]|uniref:Uncharacterized protein n=1 Tax=Dissoconium aciculare CBS 342.82 TaxID=1314786 RepID=A0A6J3LZZ9_9PEZI|nr:uncharacterized protein K489DRAFT_382759 [Dissoconium aciculare CBS 342.82]KAF1820829.1 hypothetical protein K489DRAFT_382759 [Dissoconium aciculare CBS 342.82]